MISNSVFALFGKVLSTKVHVVVRMFNYDNDN